MDADEHEFLAGPLKPESVDQFSLRRISPEAAATGLVPEIKVAAVTYWPWPFLVMAIS